MNVLAVLLVAMEGYYTKFIIFTGATPTKDANMAGIVKLLRGGADKSLARAGRNQTTTTKLGIFSTSSPRSSITS